MKDIFHLCISQLFKPCFMSSPWFFEKMNTYFTHLLGNSYSNSQNIFLLCALHPAIVGNTFYFSVDHTKLPYFKKLFNGQATIFTLNNLEHILKVGSILFEPYETFKKSQRYYLKTIQSFPNCRNSCPCHNYENIPFYAEGFTD